MPALLLVMAGGAIGAGARHLCARGASALAGPQFPVGTLGVNLIGGLLMGMLAGGLARGNLGGEAGRLFLGVGVLGGFTTFSAFSLDTMSMLERGQFGPALLYIGASVIGSIAALWAGLTLTRVIA